MLKFISKTTGKVFLVDKNDKEAYHRAVEMEFMASRDKIQAEKAKALLTPIIPQNPQLN